MAKMSTISITSTDRVFVLTGAGISAESGLPTFRADDGLWAGNRVEDVCTPDAWQRNPERGLGVLLRAPRRRRQGQAQSCALRARRTRSASATASFSARRMLTTCTSAPARSESIHMHGELTKSRCERECGRPPVRRPRRLREPRRGRPLRMRRPPAPAHRLLRRDSARDAAHSSARSPMPR